MQRNNARDKFLEIKITELINDSKVSKVVPQQLNPLLMEYYKRNGYEHTINLLGLNKLMKFGLFGFGTITYIIREHILGNDFDSKHLEQYLINHTDINEFELVEGECFIKGVGISVGRVLTGGMALEEMDTGLSIDGIDISASPYSFSKNLAYLTKEGEASLNSNVMLKLIAHHLNYITTDSNYYAIIVDSHSLDTDLAKLMGYNVLIRGFHNTLLQLVLNNTKY